MVLCALKAPSTALGHILGLDAYSRSPSFLLVLLCPAICNSMPCSTPENYPIEGALPAIPGLIRTSVCRYSSPYSDEGEAPQAGMLEAPAPTPLLASRSPERPGQERAALLPKVLGR